MRSYHYCHQYLGGVVMEFAGTPLSLAMWTILGIVLYSKISTHFRLWQASRSNGCLPPPSYPHKDPLLGLDLFLGQFKAVKCGDSATIERKRFSSHGKTFQSNSWGTRCIDTMDAQNIQAVLSQNFRKFGVEPMRLHIGEPFIGKGVFSTDGPYWEHSRNLIRPMFAKAQIADFAALDVHLNRMMDRIPRDGSTVELQALLKLMVRSSYSSSPSR